MSLLPDVGLKYNSKKIAALMAIILTFIYLLLTGSPISGQRSFLMATIVLLGIILDRNAHGMHCIITAAIVILILTPENLFSASLQMSFAASLALVATFQNKVKKLQKFLDRKNLLWCVFAYVYSLIFASLIASFATTPFIMYHFQQFSLYGVIANLFCVPLSDFVFMPAGMFALILMPINMEWLPLYIMKIGIELMVIISHYISTLPKAVIHIPSMSDSGFISISLGIFLFYILKTRIRYLAIFLLAYGFSTVYANTMPDIVISGKRKLFVISAMKEIGSERILIPSSRNVEKYTREVLAQVYGDKFDRNNALNRYKIENCNSGYCIWSMHGKTVIIIASAVEENLNERDGKIVCPQETDILFNMYSNKKCDNAKINIVARDLKEKGTHVVSLKQADHKSVKSAKFNIKNFADAFIKEMKTNNTQSSSWILEIDNVRNHITRKFR